MKKSFCWNLWLLWPGLPGMDRTCIERVIKLSPSLLSYCLSLNTNEKDEMESVARNNRLIAAFKNLLVEVMLMFIYTAPHLLINLKLILQRSNLLICILYNALFICAKQFLSRFASPEPVRMFANGHITIVQIKGEVLKSKNILDTNIMFIGFLLRSKFNELLDEGNTSERDFVQNLPLTFIAQLFFTLSTIFRYRMSFCSTHNLWIFMIKNAPFRCFFHCWEFEVKHFFWSTFLSAGSRISVPSMYHLTWYVRGSIKV